MLAAQHRKLVAQHQYLKLLAPADSTARSAPGCGAAPGRRRPDHTRPPPTKASGATTHRSPPSSRTCWSPPRPTSGTPRAPSALTDVDKAVRLASDPDAVLIEFLQTTYAAAADRGGSDRAALETDPARWDSRRRHHAV